MPTPRSRVAEQFTGWGFVTPGVAVILLFGAVPIVWSAIMSFQQNNLLNGRTPFVGLRNYQQMVHDPVVASAIAYFLFVVIIVITAIQFRVGRRFTYYRS